ncbi:MAG: succinyl-diaminopimelate desuccinylase [Polyangia bacterium]
MAQRLADTTLALCSIASVTGNERVIADELERRLRALPSVHVQRAGDSVVAEIGEGPVVALFGHSDTVKPAEDQPLGIEGDRLFGCGASDMKGGIAVMLELLTEASRGEHRGVRLRCVFYDKEEGPADESGLIPLLTEPAPVDRDVVLALCLEPTDNRVEAGCVGGLHARVTVPGQRAHSARPWQGKNALHAAAELLAALRDLQRREVVIDGLTFYEVMSATQASTDNSRNVVPDRFVLNLNYRFAPGRESSSAITELRGFVGTHVPGATIDIIDLAPSGAVRLDQPALKAWIASRGLVVAAKQAWTDVARLTSRGIAAVNFGPGDTAQAHQARESISIAALELHHEAMRTLLSTVAQS